MVVWPLPGAGCVLTRQLEALVESCRETRLSFEKHGALSGIHRLARAKKAAPQDEAVASDEYFRHHAHAITQ